MKYKLVLVKWLDHSGDAAWFDKVSVKKMKIPVATTIGWLVDEDKKTIKIADTMLEDGSFGGVSHLLKSTIVKQWAITWNKKG